MRQTLTIMGQLPRINEFAGRATRWNYSKLKKQTEQMIMTELIKQKIKPMAYAYFSFIWFEPNKKFNPDNIISSQKYILDSLVRVGILRNDGWAEVLRLSHEFVCVQGGAAGVQITLDDKG